MRINRKSVRHDLVDIESRIRAVKRALRSTPTPTSLETRVLRELKCEATLLCAILAHARNRLHFRRCTTSHAHLGLPPLETVTLEDQARFIDPHVRKYQTSDDTQPEVADVRTI